jgi:hypothetical protein
VIFGVGDGGLVTQPIAVEEVVVGPHLPLLPPHQDP